VLTHPLERPLNLSEMRAHTEERLMRLLQLFDVVLKPNGH
jgi:hypothetical protein